MLGLPPLSSTGILGVSVPTLSNAPALRKAAARRSTQVAQVLRIATTPRCPSRAHRHQMSPADGSLRPTYLQPRTVALLEEASRLFPCGLLHSTQKTRIDLGAATPLPLLRALTAQCHASPPPERIESPPLPHHTPERGARTSCAPALYAACRGAVAHRCGAELSAPKHAPPSTGTVRAGQRGMEMIHASPA